MIDLDTIKAWDKQHANEWNELKGLGCVTLNAGLRALNEAISARGSLLLEGLKQEVIDSFPCAEIYHQDEVKEMAGKTAYGLAELRTELECNPTTGFRNKHYPISVVSDTLEGCINSVRSETQDLPGLDVTKVYFRIVNCGIDVNFNSVTLRVCMTLYFSVALNALDESDTCNFTDDKGRIHHVEGEIDPRGIFK